AHGWLPERGWPQARADWRTAPRLRAGRVARAPAPAIGKGGAGAWASLQAFLLPPRPVLEAVDARSGYRLACRRSRSSVMYVQSWPTLLVLQLVDALLQGLAVELGDGVLELLVPGAAVARQGLAGELLQRRALLAAFEVFEQGAGGDVRAHADHGDQLGQQLH